MLTINKLIKLIQALDIRNVTTSLPMGRKMKIYYRGIEIGRFTENDDCSSRLEWIRTIGLAKRPLRRGDSLTVPFIEDTALTKEQIFDMLVSAYVRPVYKRKWKRGRQRATACSSRTGYISDADFTYDIREMKNYVDNQLRPNSPTPNLMTRMVMWHKRCRSKMSDFDCIYRIDYKHLAMKVTEAGKERKYITPYTLYNGRTVYATAVDDMPGLANWEELFFIKLDDRIVMVKCTSKYSQLKGMNGATETKIYYRISKVTTFTKEMAVAVALLYKETNPDRGNHE